MKRFFGVLISGLLFAPSAQALTMEKTFVQYSNVNVPTYVFLPDHVEGKIPAVLLIHGSGGLKLEHKKFYAEEFAKMGIATIAIDSFTPRGVTSTIQDQTLVAPLAMARDAMAVLKAMADNPHIDTNKVGVMGFSKGGLTVMNLALMKASKFSLYIALYPACNQFRLDPLTNTHPMLVLLGAEDKYDEPTLCKEQVEYLKEHGSKNIHLEIIPNAQHAWDVPGPAHRTVQGENYSKCKFVEIKPQVWIEEKTKIVVFDHHPTKDRPKAFRSCVTHQVSWGYSAKVTRESTKVIESFVSLLKTKSESVR
jgi:dienelactone hydrolase